MSSTR